MLDWDSFSLKDLANNVVANWLAGVLGIPSGYGILTWSLRTIDSNVILLLPWQGFIGVVFVILSIGLIVQPRLPFNNSRQKLLRWLYRLTLIICWTIWFAFSWRIWSHWHSPSAEQHKALVVIALTGSEKFPNYFEEDLQADLKQTKDGLSEEITPNLTIETILLPRDLGWLALFISQDSIVGKNSQAIRSKVNADVALTLKITASNALTNSLSIYSTDIAVAHDPFNGNPPYSNCWKVVQGDGFSYDMKRLISSWRGVSAKDMAHEIMALTAFVTGIEDYTNDNWKQTWQILDKVKMFEPSIGKTIDFWYFWYMANEQLEPQRPLIQNEENEKTIRQIVTNIQRPNEPCDLFDLAFVSTLWWALGEPESSKEAILKIDKFDDEHRPPGGAFASLPQNGPVNELGLYKEIGHQIVRLGVDQLKAKYQQLPSLDAILEADRDLLQALNETPQNQSSDLHYAFQKYWVAWQAERNDQRETYLSMRLAYVADLIQSVEPDPAFSTFMNGMQKKLAGRWFKQKHSLHAYTFLLPDILEKTSLDGIVNTANISGIVGLKAVIEEFPPSKKSLAQYYLLRDATIDCASNQKTQLAPSTNGWYYQTLPPTSTVSNFPVSSLDICEANPDKEDSDTVDLSRKGDLGVTIDNRLYIQRHFQPRICVQYTDQTYEQLNPVQPLDVRIEPTFEMQNPEAGPNKRQISVSLYCHQQLLRTDKSFNQDKRLEFHAIIDGCELRPSCSNEPVYDQLLEPVIDTRNPFTNTLLAFTPTISDRDYWVHLFISDTFTHKEITANVITADRNDGKIYLPKPRSTPVSTNR